MSNNADTFRNEFACRLVGVIPTDYIRSIMDVFDVTSNDYEISRKSTKIITCDGVPEVVKWYIAAAVVKNLSRGTIEQYYRKLVHFFETVRKPFQDVSASDIRRYLFDFRVARNACDSYLDNVRVIIHRFYAWLLDNGYVQKNPCATVEKIHVAKKKQKPLSPFELETLRWNMKDVREKAIIDLLFSSGIRVSECTSVRLSDIDWNERSIVIRHGKGDKERIAYFDSEAEVSMRKYLESRSDDTDALFVGERMPFNPLKPGSIERIIRAAGIRSRIRAYPHKLRRTFATHSIKSGMPLERLQALMGHAKPETTLIYAQLDNSDIQKEHRRVYA